MVQAMDAHACWAPLPPTDARGALSNFRRYHMSKHNTVLSSTGSTYAWALFLRSRDSGHAPPSLVQATSRTAGGSAHTRADARLRAPGEDMGQVLAL